MVSKSELLVIAACLASSAAEDESQDEESPEPAYAVLFPCWTLMVGVVAFYVLSRYARALPYTAVMFLLGAIMGITAELGNFQDHIGESIRLWTQIDHEVLLLVFLPGLLFRDAMSQNIHLFVSSISQVLIFAFPMVLAGTALVALVAFYVFPYGWPFNLAMTFGAILSATDPVAVAALLDEVGAPPRLKVHIAGESLLNDGSAIVFFSIFFDKYLFDDLADIGGQEHGADVDHVKGLAMFFQKAVGGFAVGVMFGLAQLVMLFALDRRVSREENIVQVSSIIGMAYLTFYTADFVLETSGVIATVTAGLVVKLFGRAAINDLKLLEDFMSLLEHLLNTILFTLGGIVWGTVVAAGEKDGKWSGKDWGYLILLYVLLYLIRGLLFGLAYPITVRIGLQTDLKETFFQVHGGLRGALGIALAIALDNEVKALTGNSETEAGLHTTQLFAMIGGIAFMTLVINGITAGPLLRKLGLAASTEAREKIVKSMKERLQAEATDDFVDLLTQPRFHHTNFALIKNHLPFFKSLTRGELLEAVEKHKEEHASHSAPPFLGNILPYLPIRNEEDSTLEEQKSDEAILAEFGSYIRQAKHEVGQKKKAKKKRAKQRSSKSIRMLVKDGQLSAKEFRLLFLSILKSQYERQNERGELESEHLLSIALDQSLDFAVSSVQRGDPLQDWTCLVSIHDPLAKLETKLIEANRSALSCLVDKARSRRGSRASQLQYDSLLIERAMTFMSAHRAAQKLFNQECEDLHSDDLSAEAKQVLQESFHQYALAQAALKEFDPKVVENTSSHKLCKILLNMIMYHVEKLVTKGLLKEAEAEGFLEEYEGYLNHVLSCEKDEHAGELVDVQQANPNPLLGSSKGVAGVEEAVLKEGVLEQEEEKDDSRE